MVSRLVPTSCEISSWVMPAGRAPFRDLAIGAGFEQESGEPLRHGVRQPDRAHHAIGIRAVPAQMLAGVETRVRVLFEEAHHVFATHEVQLAGLHGFNRQLVPPAGNHGVQAQNFTDFRDTHN